MMGVVQINIEGGTGGVEEPAEGAGAAIEFFVGEGAKSLTAEPVSGSTASRVGAGRSSASDSRGSVMQGALCKGVEDSRCS